jgi:hypothetical protein
MTEVHLNQHCFFYEHIPYKHGLADYIPQSLREDALRPFRDTIQPFHKDAFREDACRPFRDTFHKDAFREDACRPFRDTFHKDAFREDTSLWKHGLQPNIFYMRGGNPLEEDKIDQYKKHKTSNPKDYERLWSILTEKVSANTAKEAKVAEVAATKVAAKTEVAATKVAAAKVAEVAEAATNSMATNILNLSTTTLKQVTDAAEEVAKVAAAEVAAETEAAKVAAETEAAEAAAETEAAEAAKVAAKVAALDSILNLSNSAFAAVTEAAKEAAAKVADAAAEAEAAKVAANSMATNILNLSTTTLKQVTDAAAEVAKVAAAAEVAKVAAAEAAAKVAKVAAAKVAKVAAAEVAAKVVAAETAAKVVAAETAAKVVAAETAAKVVAAEVAAKVVAAETAAKVVAAETAAKVVAAEVAEAAKVAKAAEAAAESRVITVEGVTQSQVLERLADLEFQRNLRRIPVQFIGNLKKDLQNISDEELKPYVTKHLEYFKKKLNKDYTEKQLVGFLKNFQAWAAAEAAEAAKAAAKVAAKVAAKAAEAAEAATNEKKFSREDEKTLRDNLFIGSKGPFGWVLTRLTPLRRQAYFKKMTRIISAFIENPETKIEEKEENPALKKQYELVINILNKKTDTENKTFLIQILKEIKTEQKKSWTRKITDKLQDQAQHLKIMNMLKNILTENEMILFNSLIRESENQKNIPHMMNSRKNTKKVLNHITNTLSPLPPESDAVFNLLTKINSHENKNEKNEILDFLRSKISGLYNPPATSTAPSTVQPLGTSI